MILEELCGVLDEDEARILIGNVQGQHSQKLIYQYYPKSKYNEAAYFHSGYHIGFTNSPFCCGVTEIGGWGRPEYFRSNKVNQEKVCKNIHLLLEFINLCSKFSSHTFTTLIYGMEWVEK